ncbi:helix-turn-helix domain-containing protein [Streptomyces sp. NBC_00554]|uniref:PucR family transcriptional regulator n=1 Tax=unclassified Streptomyces TaxID=2593676 RepID=UPI00225BE6EA|nr:PucR family transcriptional regulator [Streptomyces sp. NBC_00620]MCX4974048.1 helix-turn-helix domain-containing protein [Streptomyces sp. NBC_00620]WUC51882.1 helix-turn-helix domain-containing protein [Streptomyces sp. NBC_00554]
MIPIPQGITSDPFTAVPEELVKLLRDQLEETADEVEREVRVGIPEYARHGDNYVKNLRTGVVQALTLFVDLVADPLRDWESVAATYYEIGRGEALEGRSLDALQSALRIGGRVAWRLLSQVAEEQKLDATVLAGLAEAAMVAIHEVAEVATAGYTEAQLRSTGELQRRRKRLMDLLLGDPAASAEAVQDLAHSAQWPVPQKVAVVALAAAPDGDDATAADRIMVPTGVLVGMDSRPPRMVVPDPEELSRPRGRSLALALRGRPAAVGPTVPLAEAADSLRLAIRALSLMGRGILPGRGVVRCTDHLSTLLLYGDEALLLRLSDQVLAPLDSAPGPQRDRLAETLLAWLQSGSSVGEVATLLHIHPQTVRYRLRQLDKLFGDRLRDPEARFDLELALQGASLRPAAPLVE